MTVLERFLAKVEKTETCWLWRGYIAPNGYGQIGMSNPRRVEYAHRAAYELLVGPIPEGMQLDHLCRTRACVRPDHLEPVTQRENLLRGEGVTAAHARKTHCPKGHEYDAVHDGRRACRTCAREREAAKLRDPEQRGAINARRRTRYRATVAA